MRLFAVQDPGWSNLPTVRTPYRAFDVTGLVRPGANVVAARLGFCKYGYQGAFCDGAGGATSACRGFVLQLVIKFGDGSGLNVTTDLAGPTAWQTTNSANPIVYDHLFNGEIRDNRIGSDVWDSPAHVADPRDSAADWAPAVAFHNADQLGKQMTLLPMPPIGVTAETPPVSITPLLRNKTAPASCADPDKYLVAEAAAGATATLTCAAGTGTISKIVFASFGRPWFTSGHIGRFIAGSLPNGNCADPKHVPGCIFWEDPAFKTRHFVESCVTSPCGANACGGGLVALGAGILNLTEGPQFSCADQQVSCGSPDAVRKGECDDPDTAATIAAACVGKTSCTVAANPADFGNACGSHAGLRKLIIIASGCTPAVPRAKVYVADFGQNQVGFARINSVKGNSGDTITLKYAEVLKPDGTVKMDWCVDIY